MQIFLPQSQNSILMTALNDKPHIFVNFDNIVDFSVVTPKFLISLQRRNPRIDTVPHHLGMDFR